MPVRQARKAKVAPKPARMSELKVLFPLDGSEESYACLEKALGYLPVEGFHATLLVVLNDMRGASEDMVKQFEDDTNYRGQIYLDTSASMDFGTGPANKFTYGRLLAAALTHLMILQRDAPGLVLFGPDSRQALPCAASRNQAMELFAALARAQAGGKTVISQDLFGIVQAVVRRGISVVISDFFTTDDSGFELLRQLHAHRQETLVFHLLSPEELELPETGEWILEDSETGEERIVHLDEVRTSYRERLNTFCDRVKTECQSYEFDYVRLSTGEPLDQALMNYLERRSHL